MVYGVTGGGVVVGRGSSVVLMCTLFGSCQEPNLRNVWSTKPFSCVLMFRPSPGGCSNSSLSSFSSFCSCVVAFSSGTRSIGIRTGRTLKSRVKFLTKTCFPTWESVSRKVVLTVAVLSREIGRNVVDRKSFSVQHWT